MILGNLDYMESLGACLRQHITSGVTRGPQGPRLRGARTGWGPEGPGEEKE